MALSTAGGPVRLRSKRMYVLWGVALSFLIALALFSWLVVVPYFQVRRAVERCAPLNYASGWIGPAHQEIARLGGPERAAHKLTLYLRMPQRLAPTRWAAVDILGECGEAALPALLDLLKDEHGYVRQRARWALGCMHSVCDIEPLVVALEDKDSAVRYTAVELLGGSGALRAIGPLEKALKDKDEDVRQAAAEALEKIRGEAKK